MSIFEREFEKGSKFFYLCTIFLRICYLNSDLYLYACWSLVSCGTPRKWGVMSQVKLNTIELQGLVLAGTTPKPVNQWNQKYTMIITITIFLYNPESKRPSISSLIQCYVLCTHIPIIPYSLNKSFILV